MRSAVTIESDDNRHGEFKKGDKGFVDGYVRGGNDEPLAVVVKETKKDSLEFEFVMVPLNMLKFTGFVNDFTKPTQHG